MSKGYWNILNLFLAFATTDGSGGQTTIHNWGTPQPPPAARGEKARRACPPAAKEKEVCVDFYNKMKNDINMYIFVSIIFILM